MPTVFTNLATLERIRDAATPLGYTIPKDVLDPMRLARAFEQAAPPATDPATFADVAAKQAPKAVADYATACLLAEGPRWQARRYELAEHAARRAVAAFTPHCWDAVAALGEPYADRIAALGTALTDIPAAVRGDTEKMLSGGGTTADAYVAARKAVAELTTLAALRSSLATLGATVDGDPTIVQATMFARFDDFPIFDRYRQAVTDGPAWLDRWATIVDADGVEPWLPGRDEHAAHVAEIDTARKQYARDHEGKLMLDKTGEKQTYMNAA